MRKSIVLAALAVMAFGCAKEEAGKQSGPSKQYINATIGAVQTKSGGGNADFAEAEWIAADGRMSINSTSGQLLWNEGDQIKVFNNTTHVLNGLYTAETVDGLSAVFSSETADPLNPEEEYFAMSASMVDDAFETIVNCPANQTQAEAGNSNHLGQYVFLQAPVGAGYTASFAITSTTLLEFNITSSVDADVKLQKIILESGDALNIFTNSFIPVSPWTLTYSAAITLNSTTPATLDAVDPATYWMSVVADATDYPVKVSLVTDKGIKTFDKTIPASGFEQGKCYVADLDWNDPTATFIAPAYVRVDANLTDWSGDYLLVCEGQSAGGGSTLVGRAILAFNSASADLNAANYIELAATTGNIDTPADLNAVTGGFVDRSVANTVTVTGGRIAATTALDAGRILIAPITTDAGRYSIQIPGGNYIGGGGATAGQTTATATTPTAATNKYSISVGNTTCTVAGAGNAGYTYENYATITSNGNNNNTIRVNGGTGRFGHWPNDGKQNPVALYKRNVDIIVP